MYVHQSINGVEKVLWACKYIILELKLRRFVLKSIGKVDQLAWETTRLFESKDLSEQEKHVARLVGELLLQRRSEFVEKNHLNANTRQGIDWWADKIELSKNAPVSLSSIFTALHT